MKKRIVFIIRDLNHGGAAKMLSYVANVAAEISDDIFILVINDVSNYSLGIKKNITIKIIEKTESH